MKCSQPGCSGTVVDGYCDVCGMAADTGAIGGTSVTPVTPAPAAARGTGGGV